MSPAGHPKGLPTLFIDRSLGRLRLAALLREDGLNVVTLAEHYGMPADESIEDVTWLADTAALGWVTLAKDERIRRRPAEKEAVRHHGARLFYFTRGDLPIDVYATRILGNLVAITRVCSDPGPFIYAVHPHRIERML